MQILCDCRVPYDSTHIYVVTFYTYVRKGKKLCQLVQSVSFERNQFSDNDQGVQQNISKK